MTATLNQRGGGRTGGAGPPQEAPVLLADREAPVCVRETEAVEVEVSPSPTLEAGERPDGGGGRWRCLERSGGVGRHRKKNSISINMKTFVTLLQPSTIIVVPQLLLWAV